jgi:hypothetical protein
MQSIDDLLNLVRELGDKYAEDDFMMGKLAAHINQLPAMMEAVVQARDDKAQRKQMLSSF